MSDPKEEAKRLAGYAAVDRFVADGTCIGLGTGSTALWAIRRVGERIRAGESIVAVATSVGTAALCAENGVPLVPLLSRPMAVAIDGADEVTPDFSLTKGGGGALFREKAVALAAERFVVIVDESKLVARLGAFPTPVEVVPYALPWVRREFARHFAGVSFAERTRDGIVYRTDNGNAILDGAFSSIDDPVALDAAMRGVHGVVATGLFFGLVDDVIVAGDGAVRDLARE